MWWGGGGGGGVGDEVESGARARLRCLLRTRAQVGETAVVSSLCVICGKRNDGTLTSTHANTGGEEACCTCPLPQPAQQ